MIDYDKKADAMYIQVIDKPVEYTKELDDNCLIDYDSDNTVVGVDLLCVSDIIKEG